MSFEHFLALKASAGSGKTFALSVRFISLILQGNDISKILAITFTNKAAGEMKTRIIDTFLNLQNKKAELDALCESLNSDIKRVLALRDERAEEFLSGELKIYTFDAFFNMILRRFSLNLGLMPDFAVDNISALAAGEFCHSLTKEELNKFANYLIKTKSDKPTALKYLQSIYENIDFAKRQSVDFPSEAKIWLAFNEFKKYSLTWQVKNKDSNFDKSNLQDLGSIPLLKKYDSKPNYIINELQNPAFFELYSKFATEMIRYYSRLGEFEVAELLEFAEFYSQARILAIKRKNALHFCDITKLIYKLLSDEIDAQMLYFRIDSQITHILIDEFQDTNVLQYKIIKPIICEIVSGYGQNGLGSVFYVGDTKQSIYRFRSAKKELFDKLKSDFPQIKSQSLEKNYRSDKCIVEFVNSHFAPVIKGYENQISNSQDSGYVEVVEFVENNLYDVLASKIKKLKAKNISDEKIAVLCWKNKDLSQIKNELEARSINVASETKQLLINAAPVRILLEFIKFSLFGDAIYAASLEEFLGYVPQKIKFSSKNLPQSLKYAALHLEKIDENDVNLLALYEFSVGYKDIFDFIFNIENLDKPRVDNALLGINVLTTHASKGLEFDHVLVIDKISKSKPDIDFMIEFDDENDVWDISNNSSVLNNLLDEFADTPELIKYAQIKSRYDTLNNEEELNKLYVALTRAKHSLIILANAESNGNYPSYFLPHSKGSGKAKVYENAILPLEICEFGEIKGETSEIKPVKSKKLEKFEFVDKQNIVKRSNSGVLINFESALFGTAMHYFLEMLGGFESEFTQTAATATKNKFGANLDFNSLKIIKNSVELLIKNPEFIALTAGKTLLKEQNVAYDGKISRFDLLCISDTEIIVIDYKTSQNLSQEHEEQVKNYIKILREIYPNSLVRGAIAYLLANESKIVEVKI